uniref:Uncharacterized protein n=2 Tax=Timema TaxID=61471 RepID=A0A7R9DGM2_TIMPO|nr:unnamed protein product [Timema poppensis]
MLGMLSSTAEDGEIELRISFGSPSIFVFYWLIASQLNYINARDEQCSSPPDKLGTSKTSTFRYIALEVNPHSRSYDTPFKLKAHSLYTTIIKKIEQLYGDFGVAALKGGFIAKYCNEKTRVAFVRARHGPHRLLASCLPLVNRIENHQVMLRILYTGATLRQCYKFIQKYQRSQLQRFWATLKTDKQRKEMEDAVMNLKFTQVPSKD